MLDHTVPDQEVELTAPEGQSEIQLHIMVENQGRVNYADYGTSVLNNQRRGKNQSWVNYADYGMSVLNNQRRVMLISATKSVTDPGFLRGGGTNIRFCQIEIMWVPRGGGRPKFYYVDPSLQAKHKL